MGRYAMKFSVSPLQIKICEDHNLGSLILLLDMPQEGVRELVSNVINNLAEKDAEISITSDESIWNLVLLAQFSEKDVQKEAIRSLANLASNSSLCERIEQVVGWFNIVKYASLVSDIQASTATLVGNLALSKKTHEAVLQKGVPILKRLFTSTDLNVRRAVATAFSNITLIRGESIEFFWVECGGLEMVMPLLRHEEDLQIQISTLKTIVNLCSYNDSLALQQQVVAQGGLQYLVPLVSKNNNKITKLAARIVAILADREENVAVLRELNIVEPLMHLLDSYATDHDVKKEARQALKKILPVHYAAVLGTSDLDSGSSSDSELETKLEVHERPILRHTKRVSTVKPIATIEHPLPQEPVISTPTSAAVYSNNKDLREKREEYLAKFKQEFLQPPSALPLSANPPSTETLLAAVNKAVFSPPTPSVLSSSSHTHSVPPKTLTPSTENSTGCNPSPMHSRSPARTRSPTRTHSPARAHSPTRTRSPARARSPSTTPPTPTFGGAHTPTPTSPTTPAPTSLPPPIPALNHASSSPTPTIQVTLEATTPPTPFMASPLTAPSHTIASTSSTPSTPSPPTPTIPSASSAQIVSDLIPSLPPSSSPKSNTMRGANGVLLIPHAQLQYTDANEIGSGAQGIVYKVQWKSRDVVFKKIFLRHQSIIDERVFLNELEVWRNIHHPNSVSLYGAVNDSGRIGYVMEYCPNGNLHDQMKNGMVLGPTKTIDLICGIADILSILHDSAIAHRDIKAANIMLDRDFHPKLGDFGLSRMLATTQASATNLIGTPTHMAPEQFITNAKHSPMKADVYSFGMVMYELATNKVPFGGKSSLEITRLVEQGERPSVQSDLPTGMEEDERAIWWKIVTQCWAQDPLLRPSMEQVSKMLMDLRKQILERIQGFCCKEHKIGKHDYFLSYRVATESNTVNELFDLLTQTKRKSGDSIKVFLDAKCLPDAEDWQKSFLYGLHHTKIIVPVVSSAGLIHFQKAHEENDNVLLEYEHMLSLLTLWKGKVKVFPIFIDAFPRATDYPDKPHITTGKNIRKTIEGISRLQGRKIKSIELATVLPALLEKLEELDIGANASLTISNTGAAQQASEVDVEVFIQVEGEKQRDNCISVPVSATLDFLRTTIIDQLDDFDFEFKFLKTTGTRTAVITIKQETIKTVGDIIDTDFNVTVRKV